MFFEIIAIFFLILFLIKLLSPNVFPLIGKFFNQFLSYISKLINILFNGLLRSVTLLLSKTVYVVGIVILATLVIATTYTLIKNSNIMEINVWFDQFKESLLEIYVSTFFIGTYILGIIDYLKDRTAISTKFMNYVNSQFRKNGKQYVYDEETKKYIYK